MHEDVEGGGGELFADFADGKKGTAEVFGAVVAVFLRLGYVLFMLRGELGVG